MGYKTFGDSKCSVFLPSELVELLSPCPVILSPCALIVNMSSQLWSAYGLLPGENSHTACTNHLEILHLYFGFTSYILYLSVESLEREALIDIYVMAN